MRYSGIVPIARRVTANTKRTFRVWVNKKWTYNYEVIANETNIVFKVLQSEPLLSRLKTIGDAIESLCDATMVRFKRHN